MRNNEPDDAFLEAVRFQGGPSWNSVLKRATVGFQNVPSNTPFVPPAIIGLPSQTLPLSQAEHLLYTIGGMPEPLQSLPGANAPIDPNLIVLGSQAASVGTPLSPRASPWDPAGAGALFAVADGPPVDPQGVYPWPCGRTVSQRDFNMRRGNTAGIIESQIPLLDGYGPGASKEACEQILQTLLINPGTGLATLKAARVRLPGNSALVSRLDTLIACGETLTDFAPFVQGMSGMLEGLSETGDTPPTEFPCEVAKAKLVQLVAQNPAQVGARLAAMASQITASNATSRRLLGELNTVSGMLMGIGLLPGVLPLPAADVGGVSSFMTQRVLNLYGSIVNGDFCECPEPGSGPLG